MSPQGYGRQNQHDSQSLAIAVFWLVVYIVVVLFVLSLDFALECNTMVGVVNF